MVSGVHMEIDLRPYTRGATIYEGNSTTFERSYGAQWNELTKEVGHENLGLNFKFLCLLRHKFNLKGV